MTSTELEADEDSLVPIATELLPERWRNDVRVERVSGAITVLFRDPDGLLHAFDMRAVDGEERAPVQGPAVAYSYKEVDPEVDALDLLDAYRDALQQFATKEALWEAWLKRPPPLRNDCAPAGEGLRELLVAALPEAWREGAEAFVTADGFELRFRDETGALHGFDGRRVGAGVTAFVQGEALAFAYSVLDARVDAARWAERYREALAPFVEREGAMVEALKSDPGFGRVSTEAAAAQGDLRDDGVDAAATRTDCEPAPEALSALLLSILDARWRGDARAFVTPDGFVVRGRDEDGRSHGFEGRFSHAGVRAMIRGARLGYAYERLSDGDLSALFDAFNETLRAFAAREGEVLPLLEAALRKPDVPTLGTHEREVSPELLGLLREEVPEAWRGSLSATILTNESLTVRARDADGIAHELDLRRLRRHQPSMVQGAALGYSYRKSDPRLDEDAAIPKYRELFARLVAREAELVALLDALRMR